MPSLLPGSNQADQILAVTRGLALTFFDQTLLGRPNQLLSKSAHTPQVTLEVYGPE